jgi:hypothetical protein
LNQVQGHRPSRLFARRLAIGLSAYATAGGFASLIGWFADVQRLTDWTNTGISIQPNAAIAVILSGASVLLLVRGFKRASATAAAVVAAIGGLTLFEYISRVSLGIDAALLFGREWGQRGVLVPGRMGPPGAT